VIRHQAGKGRVGREAGACPHSKEAKSASENLQRSTPTSVLFRGIHHDANARFEKGNGAMTFRSNYLAFASLFLIGCSGSSQSSPPPPPDMQPTPSAGCTLTLSGALTGKGTCIADPGTSGSQTVISYVLSGTDRQTGFNVQANQGDFTYGSGAVAPLVVVQFHIAGNPSAKTYGSQDPSLLLDESVGIDFENASYDYFEWGFSRERVNLTLGLTSVTLSSEKPANAGEQDFVAHGSLDATLDPTSTTKASGQVKLHLSF
jgi:hypothetical protein